MNPLSKRSPRLIARIAGLFYLGIFLAAPSGAASATPLKMAINLTCDLAVALLFYDLLKPVSRTLSLIAALFRLIFIVSMSITTLNFFGVTSLFQPTHSPSAFDYGYGISLIPFGIHCCLTGYLIYRSNFLPRTLGILMALAGAGYLLFLSPELGSRLFFPWIAILGVTGEGALTLWLLIKGANPERWTQSYNDSKNLAG